MRRRTDGAALRSVLIMIAALLGMLLMPAMFSHRPVDPAVIAVRQAVVQAAVDRVPYVIGEWRGVDVPVPEAAQRILRPTAVLSRRYRHAGDDRAAHLMVIHCADVRDMEGHYPPICYPAQGWLQDGDAEPDQLAIADRKVAVNRYRFTRVDGWSDSRSIRIFNVFLLPGGVTCNEMSTVSRLTQDYSASGLGIAQIQVIVDGQGDLNMARTDAEGLLRSAGELLAVVMADERGRAEE